MPKTQMYQEAAECASAVARQIRNNRIDMQALGRRFRRNPPRLVITSARGSSDHAAMYAKYLIETHAGIVVASAAPSISSIYAAEQDVRGVVFLAISQSGMSPDLVRQAEMARDGGATVVAMVNVGHSPLAELADVYIPLWAGPESSVAATKSYICSLTAILQLTACWSANAKLLDALINISEQLEQAWELNWQKAVQQLTDIEHMFVIARGFGYGIALEAALKFKETCQIHAEAVSAAEVRHGPMAIVDDGFPVLMFGQDDQSRSGLNRLATEFYERGSRVLLAATNAPSDIALPVVFGAIPEISPILQIQSFYRMIDALSCARGKNPDVPPHLRKVTETV